MDNQKVFRIGPIRPPSEANSLLLQVTAGCTWNKCKFCQLYRHTKFKAYTVDSIKTDIDVMEYYKDLIMKHQRNDGSFDHRDIMDEILSKRLTSEEQNCFYMIYNWLLNGGKNVFLQDGNTLALSAGRLTEVLYYLKSKFPTIKRITSYGRAETLSKVTASQYKELKEAGLDRIHSGFESGSDLVLELINKGVTSEEQIIAGKNIKEGGIELSVYFMPGIGGETLSEENALGTSRVVREINPDFVRIRTAVIKEGTELWQEYINNGFELCSDNDKVLEIRKLIENTNSCQGILVSDHIINLLQDVTGRLDKDNKKMLSIIDEYLNLSIIEQRRYQLARRAGLVSRIEDMQLLTDIQRNQIDKYSKDVFSETEWDKKMNELIMNYI
ncbi:radical SAM protein [Anaerovorax odorimutans]|uniref:radical SAM protein n=1 Tax=Anaerovorax odorimutans TaxID=109327 RepID=UPI0003F8B035|nr:radical SAM protein [Anaerovorax odorimutans]